MHESVRERDLDHLLLEELHACDAFREWFLSRVPDFDAGTYAKFQVHRFRRRELDGRETDLLIDFLDKSNKGIARLFIENKVDADFQPGQPESYRNEVSELRKSFGYTRIASVLTGPERYRTINGADCFDVFVSLDEILLRFEAKLLETVDEEPRRRIEVKLDLLQRLTGRRRGSSDDLQGPLVAEKRDFSARYRALVASRLGQGFVVSDSTDGPKAFTKLFDLFPNKDAFGFEVKIRHEFGKVDKERFKYANLQFPGRANRLEALRSLCVFPSDGSIFPDSAGGSLAVRIVTPAIDPRGDLFDAQQSELDSCMIAIKRLVDWLEENHENILAAFR